MKEILIDGKYLGHELCAFSGNWVIVYDGNYNYYLFDCERESIINRYEHGWMPSNGTNKQAEYYSNFDSALNGLMNVVPHNGFVAL